MVLDAGAFLELLFRSDAGLQVEEALIADDDVHAPEVLDAEVLHRLLQMGKAGQLTAPQVEAAVADLRDAPVHRVSHRGLLVEATRLGAALSGYDALYVATARVLDRPLWTADVRLARTAHRQFGVEAIAVASSGRSG